MALLFEITLLILSLVYQNCAQYGNAYFNDWRNEGDYGEPRNENYYDGANENYYPGPTNFVPIVTNQPVLFQPPTTTTYTTYRTIPNVFQPPPITSTYTTYTNYRTIPNTIQPPPMTSTYNPYAIYTNYRTIPNVLQPPRRTMPIARPPDRFIKLQVYGILEFSPVVLYLTYVLCL